MRSADGGWRMSAGAREVPMPPGLVCYLLLRPAHCCFTHFLHMLLMNTALEERWPPAQISMFQEASLTPWHLPTQMPHVHHSIFRGLHHCSQVRYAKSIMQNPCYTSHVHFRPSECFQTFWSQQVHQLPGTRRILGSLTCTQQVHNITCS